MRPACSSSTSLTSPRLSRSPTSQRVRWARVIKLLENSGRSLDSELSDHETDEFVQRQPALASLYTAAGRPGSAPERETSTACSQREGMLLVLLPRRKESCLGSCAFCFDPALLSSVELDFVGANAGVRLQAGVRMRSREDSAAGDLSARETGGVESGAEAGAPVKPISSRNP